MHPRLQAPEIAVARSIEHDCLPVEYSTLGQYRSFAAVIGIDDSTKGRGSVTFRVRADGKQIYEKSLTGKDDPVSVSLPLEGVSTLRLEVDYGADGLDAGDHADWASARLSKSTPKKAEASTP